jgi:1-deoxy-D-xylulose-5-phosphate synthase
MIPDTYTEQASQAEMYAAAGLDRAGIVTTVLTTLGRDAAELPARA